MKKALLMVIFLPVFAWAQTPGYLGKRFILSYNLDVAPNLTYVYGTAIGGNNGNGLIPVQILFNHHLNAEYVLWRRFSIGADLSYNQNRPLVPDAIVTESSSKFGIDFIFYPNNDNTLAPVGNYFKLKLFTGSYAAKGLVQNEVDGLNGPNYVLQPAQAAQNINGIGVGFGNNMVVYNRVVITASINVDLNLPTTTNLAHPISADYDISDLMANQYLETYLIYVKLGIGGLLF